MPDYKKELEEFSYIVSHDLNAPLRHIKAFSGMLVESIKSDATDQQKLYIEHIENGVNKSQDMISALLEYSRIMSESQDFSEFNCHDLVNSLIANIDGDITVTNLPTVINAHKHQITQLFSILLDNAIQFKSSARPLKIEISAKQDNEQWQFTMTDNGIGMSPEQINQAFIMFRRFNNANNYEGIGAGLTIAKKIVENHGGGISIKSELDHHTHVSFNLLNAKN